MMIMNLEALTALIQLDFLDSAAILAYLVIRDRLMRNALLQLAEETEGVDRDHVAEKIRVRGD
jgi:hypothetical protein